VFLRGAAGAVLGTEISGQMIAIALQRAPIEDVFLKMVDPLDLVHTVERLGRSKRYRSQLLFRSCPGSSEPIVMTRFIR